MTVETDKSLRKTRPEQIGREIVLRETLDIFSDNGMNTINDAGNVSVASDVVSEIVEKDLSDKLGTPYAFFSLRGEITHLLINALATYERRRRDKLPSE